MDLVEKEKETLEAIKALFQESLEVYYQSLKKMSQKELRKAILDTEQAFLKNHQKMDYINIILAQTVYKRRFKREVLLSEQTKTYYN